ncbi:ESF1 homolog [Fundulus diaphanus]
MSSRKKPDDDERFRRVQKDPRFWEMPEKEHKVKIDKRFQSMFHDQRFKVKQTVDKRGRPVSHSTADDLKRFYQLSDSEEEEEQENQQEEQENQEEGPEGEKKAAERTERGIRAAEKDDDDEEQLSEDEEEEEESDEAAGSDEESSLGSDSDSGPDLARGKGNMETSSDEDEDDDDDVDDVLKEEDEAIEHDWGELCKDAPRSDEVSARLAVCNMDWDRLKAKDLLALFNSFVPKGGAVLSVKIFPSDFGKERLRVEQTQGPPELKALPDDSEDDTEEERVFREKLRDYQFKRLKYFYAVVECDSVETAAKIYEECDGYEYESSCSVLDLRFIPDDVTFEEEPRDAATDINLAAYAPKLFTSSAAATSKVQLTWDETDHERVTALNRKFNKEELLDLDFKAYLASSSEEDGDEEQEDGAAEEEKPPEKEEEKKKKKMKKSEEQINKYRELLKSIQVKERKLQEDRDMEMEITWVPGLKETTEQLVKKKLEDKERTPWEEYLQKKQQKKKQKKSGRKQGDDEELSDDELPPDVDLSDPFFSEELGASDPKKKQKKKKEEEPRTAEEEEELEKQKAEMALLMEDDGDEAKHEHFNYDKIVEQQNLSKKKRKKLLKKGDAALEDDFQVDVSDPRFQAVFTSHLFNLDPSHPSFRKTRATQSILEEKQRRRQEGLGAHKATPTSDKGAEPGGKQEAAEAKREKDSVTERTGMDPSLSMLVKSIKSKTERFQARKKRKVT